MNYGPASKYYDLFGSKDDIPFYRELALKHGRKALELGVGTGRVAIELAKAGVTVLGIDNSRYMLNVTRSKLEKEDASVRELVTLKYGDMRNLRLKEKVPFAYLASATFEHCITTKEQRDCLSNVINALEEKGVLAFDMSQPAPGKPDSSWWIDRAETNTGEEAVRTIFSRRNPRTDIVSVNLFFDVRARFKLSFQYASNGT
jgi:ubiquinone/menaquinone biosynthesis C-methylase UbiE